MGVMDGADLHMQKGAHKQCVISLLAWDILLCSCHHWQSCLLRASTPGSWLQISVEMTRLGIMFPFWRILKKIHQQTQLVRRRRGDNQVRKVQMSWIWISQSISAGKATLQATLETVRNLDRKSMHILYKRKKKSLQSYKTISTEVTSNKSVLSWNRILKWTM